MVEGSGAEGLDSQNLAIGLRLSDFRVSAAFGCIWLLFGSESNKQDL